jgi:sugar phosphate isomerase/epimerase
MNTRLGINLGFATNRYIEPEVWTNIVSQKLGLKYVQFVADLLNPSLPSEYIDDQVNRINGCTKKEGIQIENCFTSSFTRVNHLMHPDAEMRRWWLQWFKDFFTIGARLGAKAGGSHFGILTFDSYEDEARREQLIEEGVKGWQALSFFVKELGYEYLLMEPMSVPREMANTIEDTLSLVDRVNAHCGVPMRVNLDAGHAPHPDQRDPYPWMERLGPISPVVHIQQTVLHKSNHSPFIPEYNQAGIVQPEKVIGALEKSGAQDVSLVFEISHREHWDTDFRIIEDLKASVDYWRPYVKD